MTRRCLSFAGLLLGLIVAGCAAGGSPAGSDDSSTVTIGPVGRAAIIATEGCGFASGRTGSGVAVGGGLVVTVAHLVVHASSAAVSIGGGPANDETVVVAVDAQRDLALLHLPGQDLPDLAMASARKGDRGSVVGAATSGTVPFRIRGAVELSIEDVLGSERHSRLGYQLEAVTAGGDSGAGVYDAQGRLIGVVFATSDDGATTWATAATEIQDFLGATSPEDVYELCN